MRVLDRTALLLILPLMFFAGCGTKAGGSDADKAARIAKMYADYSKKFPEVSGISAEELQRTEQERKVVLVDVRTPEEQAISMLPGAVTQEEFEARLDDYRDSLVVAYCTIGARSGEYAAKLAAEGLEVRNLEGSILAWTHAGGELEGPDGPTRKVHVYGRRWNLAADGYEAVW